MGQKEATMASYWLYAIPPVMALVLFLATGHAVNWLRP